MKINNRGKIAISEIFILLISIAAIAYAVGSSVGFVSGAEVGSPIFDPDTGEQIGVIITEVTQPPVIIRGVSSPPISEIPTEAAWVGPVNDQYNVLFDSVSGVEGGQQAVRDAFWDAGGGREGLAAAKATVSKLLPEGSSWLSKQFGASAGSTADYWLSALQYAAIAYFAAQMLGEGLGLDTDQTNALSFSAAAGAAAYKIAEIAGANALGWGLGVGLVAMIFSYKEKSYRVVTFNCDSWQADIKGDNCEECNRQGILPCSEYQCRSLGQTCKLVNVGTIEEACVDSNPRDVDYPIIEPWLDELTPGYTYTPDNTISPPDRGVKIINSQSEDGCVKAFTTLKFGVKLNEIAKCKVDAVRRGNYSDMLYTLSKGLNKYNHTIQLNLPGASTLEAENIELQNNGNFSVYIRCSDDRGNSNPADFVFKYCVDPGPDTTPPMIVTTNIINGNPVAFGQQTLDLQVYLNEPAECSWSHKEESYENMPEKMTCATGVEDSMEFNSQKVYLCSTNLTGIQDKKENKFYFRCKDQPALEGTNKSGDRNINAESYIYTVIGTQPLVIDKVGPANETIKDSAIAVKVTLTAETSAGYKEGLATCYYALEGDKNFVEFYNTHSHTHSTDLYLPEGEYTYQIKCVDLGGNSDIETVDFETESDSEAPQIVRAYHEVPYLKIVTNEKAECVYDTKSCTYLFEDGLPMTPGSIEGENTHYVDWSTKTKFYIKCRDEYGNEPAPDACSAIIRAIEN